MKHQNEVNLTPENLPQLLEEAQARGKQYVHALREQMDRQGVKDVSSAQK
jgi:hypothetical protein